jgi:hypothetical protein
MNIKKNLLTFVLFITILFSVSEPSPPLVPKVEVVSSHERVTIIWDDLSEGSIDQLSGYSDFEGYRIYRSTDGGITWGEREADKIYDYEQNFVGWKPYAQFDLVSELDSTHCIYTNDYYDEKKMPCKIRSLDVRGYDPIAQWINLGDNEGLKREFIDEDILDGVEYTYAVTAYDMGMITFSLEYDSEDPGNLTDNYCSDNDSFCDGNECCSNESCCYYDVDPRDGKHDGWDENEPVIDNQVTCLAAAGIGDVLWLPETYTSEESCLGASLQYDDGDMLSWKIANHGLVDYTNKTKCEAAGHEWQDIVYLSEEARENAEGGYTWNGIEFSITPFSILTSFFTQIYNILPLMTCSFALSLISIIN